MSGETLIRPQILRRLADEGRVSMEQADAVLTSLEGMIRSVVHGGPRVKLKVGTFSAQRRPARVGRNPKTGEPVQVLAKSVISFKPSLGTVRVDDGEGDPSSSLIID